MADDNKPKSVFYGVMQALRGPKNPATDVQQSKDLLMGSPAPGMEDVDFIQQKQQQYLDLQSVKIAQDLYSRTLFYDTDRITAYNDFRSMDMTPEIAAALDIISDEVCTRNERGNVISIYSDNLRIKKILQELFYRTLNAEFNLSFWTRELCKYGDCFLKLEVDQNEGIYDCMMLPVGEVHKEIGYDGNPKSTRYKWDINNMFFEEWQVSHFCLLFDAARLPYGRSILDPARKLWKQLQLAEDAMLVYRLSRAPERRIFYIEVGNTDPNDVYQLIESVKKSIKKSTVVDPNTGRVNLKYNPMPVWKNTPIPLLDGRTITIEELAREFEEGKENYVYSVQDNTHGTVAGKVIWCGKNYTATKLVKVWLDDNTWVMTAPEHPFVMRDGTQKRADELNEGESLMPFYFEHKALFKNLRNYTYSAVYDPATNDYGFVHRIIAKDIPKGNESYNTIHHKNFNRYDNRPENLEWVDFHEHKKMHSENQINKWKNPEYRENSIRKITKTLRKLWSEGKLEKNREVSTKNMIAWNQSEEKKKRVSAKNIERDSVKAMSWYNDSDLHKEHNKIRSEAMTEMWADTEKKTKAKESMKIKFSQECLDIACREIKSFHEFISADDFVSHLKNTDFFAELKNCNKDTRRNLEKFFNSRSALRRFLNDSGISSYNEFLMTYNPELLEKKKQKYRENRLVWNKENIVRGIDGKMQFKNHKVLRVEFVDSEGEDVYCMTVVGMDGEHDRHNFACLSFNDDGSASKSGVYVRNTYEEDFFLPVRGEKSSKIETLPGACLGLDTKIELLDGRSLELSEIIKEYETGKQLWSYSINTKTGEVVPGKITWAGVTRKNTDVVKITLDNGETITTTPDHKFPTRFNGIKQAKELSVGESMWAFNKKFEKIKGAGKKRKRNTYEMIFDHKGNNWIYTHRMVANFFKERNEEEDFLFLEQYRFEDKKTIHHKDFNRYNNSPENLCFMNPKDHFYYHQNNVEKLHEFFGPEKVEEWKEMRKDGLRKYFSNLSKEELIVKANVARENSINSRQKSVSTFKKNPNRNEIIRKNCLKSKSTKNKPENKIRYSINSKELWRNKEYVESVIGPQRIVYDEKMLSILSDFIKNGVDKTKDILPIINQPEHEFHELFFGANASNQQLKKSNGITHNNLDKLVKHYGYNNWRSFKKTAECFNHKIVSIEYLSEKQDTGTITIDGPEQYHNFHNFALSVGIFTQNSNLDAIADIEYLQNKLFASIKVPKTYLNYAESMPGGSTLSQVDLRFARTINRIQEQIILELRRVANIHLYFLGFEDDLDNFTITLTNPSTQLELLKLETWKARMEVFKELFSSEVTSPVSYSWAMEYILGFSKSEIKQIIRQKKVEKKMFSEIERANEEYMDTGIFKELDEKFRKADFVPEGGPSAGGEEGAGGGEAAGGGEGFQGSSVLGGLGGGGAEMPPTGGTEDAAPEAAPEAGAEAPAGGEEEPPITENRLITENRKFDIQTRKLMKSIDSHLAKIKRDSGDETDSSKETL